MLDSVLDTGDIIKKANKISYGVNISLGYRCVPSCCGCFQLFVTPWTVAHQAPLSMGFSRQEYWSGLLFPAPGIKPTSLMSPALAGRFFTASITWEAP